MRKIKKLRLKPKARKALEKKKKGVVPSISERASLCSAYKRSMSRKPTLAEIRMIWLLQHLRLEYIFQKAFLTKYSFYIVDFYLSDYKLVIEVDGKRHYADKNQSWYDDKRTTYLQDVRRCKVIRFTNKEIINESEKVKNMLQSLIVTHENAPS